MYMITLTNVNKLHIEINQNNFYILLQFELYLQSDTMKGSVVMKFKSGLDYCKKLV